MLIFLFIGCENDAPTQVPRETSNSANFSSDIIINFDGSLQGDSVRIQFDSYWVLSVLIDTTDRAGTSGIIVGPNPGFYRIGITVPAESITAQVWVCAYPGCLIEMFVHFDEASNRLMIQVPLGLQNS